jgi:hypothetical protein
MNSPLTRGRTGLLNEAAQLRKQADALNLTFPERQELLLEARLLELRAERMHGERKAAPPPLRIPPPQRADPPPPPPPPPPPRPKKFHATPGQIARYRHEARRAGEAAKRAQASGDAKLAETLSREARRWQMMAQGLMPSGWTPDGPKGTPMRGNLRRDLPKQAQPLLPPLPRPETALTAVAGRRLRFDCHCGKRRDIPAVDLADALGPGAELRDALQRLRCTECRNRLSSVFVLPESHGSDDDD